MKSLIRTGILIGLFLMLIPKASVSQYIDEKLLSLFDAQTKYFEDESSINYRLMIPDSVKNGKKFPLVLFLHGSGERGNDNLSQLKWGVQEFAKPYRRARFPAFVVAPQCPADQRWSSIDWDADKLVLPDSASAMMNKLKQLVEYLISDFPIDTNRVYITGLSMGGYGAYDAIIRWPDMWTASALVCGATETKRLKDITDIPMWLFHGAQDGVVDVNHSREAYQSLKKVNQHVRYTEYPYVNHFSWQPAYATEELYEWMFSFEGIKPERKQTTLD